jgi:hypothetical protein
MHHNKQITNTLNTKHTHTHTNSCEGHGMYDNVLQDLPLPSELIEKFDVNQDGLLNNIEFYEASDPTKEGGMNYIYDHFTWNHCEKQTVEVDLGQLFVNGMAPSEWMGASYKTLKKDSVKGEQSIKVHRQQVEVINSTHTHIYVCGYIGWRSAFMIVSIIWMIDTQHINYPPSLPTQAGLRPGKSLAKVAKYPGSMEDYNTIMSLIEKNN